MGDKMDLSNKFHKRRFSMVSGFMVGFITIFMINITGLNPGRYMAIFNTANFFMHPHLLGFIISMVPFSLAIICAGVVTTALLSEKKRNCIFGGITGMWLILVGMLISYSLGVMQFPISSQIEAILGFPGLILVFLIYAVPITMLGFILGYFGSFLTEQFSYNGSSF